MLQTTYVLGAGSLGLLYAARLGLTGKSVCLLVKPSQANQLGLGITLSEGPADLAKRVFVRVLSPLNSPPEIQHLIIATKAHQAAPALNKWLACLSPNAEILMLQNGLGSQAEVAKLLSPEQTLLTASVTEGAYTTEPGAVIHAGKGQTELGLWSGSNTSAADRWVNTLTIAGLSAIKSEPIRPVLWHKLAVNAVINPLTAINAVENGALASHEFKPQVETLIAEINQLFQRLGIPEPTGGLAHKIEQVILATASNKSSMLQDFTAGKTTEIDYITASLLKAAQAAKIAMPAHMQLYKQFKLLEQQRS